MIFADNDEPGQIYAETIAASVAPFAYAVRVISFAEIAGWSPSPAGWPAHPYAW